MAEILRVLNGSLSLLLNRLLDQLDSLGVDLHTNSPVDGVFSNDRILNLKVKGELQRSKYLFTMPTPTIAKLFDGHNFQDIRIFQK